MKPIDKINLFTISAVLLTGVALSYAMRSASVFFAAFIFIFGIHVAQACAVSVLAVWRREHEAGPFTAAQFVVALAALLLVAMGLASMIERVVWFNSTTVPALFISKDFGDRYSANKHRMLKMMCETRHSPMFVQESDGRIFARCGEWYPDVYTVSATKGAWDRAVVETRNDPPGMAYVIESDNDPAK